MFFKSKRLKQIEELFTSIKIQLDQDNEILTKFYKEIENITWLNDAQKKIGLKNKEEFKNYANYLGKEGLKFRDNKNKNKELIAASNAYAIYAMFYELQSMSGKGVKETLVEFENFLKIQKIQIDKIKSKNANVNKILTSIDRVDTALKNDELKLKKNELIKKIKYYLFRQYPLENKTDEKVVELLDYVPLDHFVLGYIGKFTDLVLQSNYNLKNHKKEEIRLLWSEVLEYFFYNSGEDGLDLLKILNISLIGGLLPYETFLKLGINHIKYEQLTGKGSIKSFLYGAFSADADFVSLNKDKNYLPNRLLNYFKKDNSYNSGFNELIKVIDQYGEAKLMKEMSLKLLFEFSFELLVSNLTESEILKLKT